MFVFAWGEMIGRFSLVATLFVRRRLSDGVFDGDGRFLCSYKNPGNDPVKIRYNSALREVRQGVENSYQRVGAWFPLLGNNKENLSYSALESPEGLFRNYY
jgi:hypothetical protein